MNIALTNYGHRYTAELVKRNPPKQLDPHTPVAFSSEEHDLLLKLWMETSLPHRDQPVYRRLIGQGLIEPVSAAVPRTEIRLRYRRNPLEHIDRIIFEITTRCNFSCGHCYNTRVPPATEQNLAGLKQAADVFVRLGIRQFDFIGGEVSKFGTGWLDLVRYLRTQGNFVISLFTNGWWLEQHDFVAAGQRYPDAFAYLADLKESGLSHVVFSLDGRSAFHDHNRGQPGLYQRILTGMDLVRTAGLEPRVSALVRRDQNPLQLALFLAELADRIYRFSAGTDLFEKINVLANDPTNALSNFIDIGNGAGRGAEGFRLSGVPDEKLACKGFFRPAPFLTIKANGELATCRITNAGEGYGNLHGQDLVYLLNHLQDNFVFKLHAERRLAGYRRFMDPAIFGDTFVSLCTPRAILTLIARLMEERVTNPDDSAAIGQINREVARFTGYI